VRRGGAVGQTGPVTDRPAATTEPPARLSPGPRTYLLAALLGIPVGAVAGVYLWLVRVLRELVWDGHEARLAEWLPAGVAVVVTTTVGGLLVGLVRVRHDRTSPHDLDDVLADVDEAVAADAEEATLLAAASRGSDAAGAPAAVESADAAPGAERPAVEPQPAPEPHAAPVVKSVPWILRSVGLGIVSLTAGASLGPEAPLLALAMGFGQRMARLLRLSASEAVTVTSAGALSGLFGGPLGAAVLVAENRHPSAANIRLLGPGIVSGLTGFAAMLLVLPDGPGVRYTVPDDGSGALEAIGWGAVAAVPAALAAALILVLLAPTRRVVDRVPTVPRATVGGLVLGLAAVVQPLVLFSGEHEGQDLIDQLGTWTVGALLVLIALKVLATVVSLTTGYFGGQIFPGSFLGMAAGALVIALVPAAPSAVGAAGAAAGTTVLLRRPLASALIMLFFFPTNAAVPLLVGAGIGAAMVSLLGNRLPAPTPVGGH
jgi:H+/Cl- antiporter ClcA